MLIGALPNHLLVPTHLPPSLGPPSSDQSLQTLTRFPLALQKLHFSMESEDPWMRNRGSSWQRCSHTGASFRPSSLNSGSHGCDPYGIVHLNVEITWLAFFFSECPTTKNKLRTKHVTKRSVSSAPNAHVCQPSLQLWFTAAALVGWEHTAFTHCPVHAVTACNASQSCLEYLSWDLRPLCAMNYGLFIIDTKLSAPVETMV